MAIDINTRINLAQIAFALSAIALLLMIVVYNRFSPKDRKKQ